MGDVALIVRSKARDGKSDEIRRLYEGLLAQHALENPSQEVVVWCADQHDPDAFYLFEIYTDAEAMGANAQATWFADYMAQAGSLLAGEPEVASRRRCGRRGSRDRRTSKRRPRSGT